MNALEKIVHLSVREETQKKAISLAKQMGLKSVPDDMIELISKNLLYSRQFTPELYTKYQRIKLLLNELSEKKSPKQGHIVKFTNQYATYDQSALFLKAGFNILARHHDLIACSGAKHIYQGDLELEEYGLDMEVSCGGPFATISVVQLQSLSEFDVYETYYTFWGETPCASGMIWMTFPMKCWFLTV